MLAWPAVRSPTDTIPAPPFPRELRWFNVAALRMDKQRGRPVLVEFWDFCRANSLRTLPYLQAWHERYGERGLRVIGVHTGGWDFSRDEDAIGRAIERLRPRLRSFRDEHGRELLDVPQGALPHPETSAPPRFLPNGDNAVLAHADRSRIVCDAHRRCVTANMTFLVDGFVRGTWKVMRGPKVTTLVISPLAAIERDDRLALAEEGAALLAFTLGEDSDSRVSVRFVEP